ncbi:MAG: anaerobic ribonucleoside triphosphate reductase [Coriobacteriales bacterium]|jgi:ribonucleoside-triphosphate reductase|nr:anaerobic ribonucleoside triphosphate reductase [Coriobacteriales bacterium]
MKEVQENAKVLVEAPLVIKKRDGELQEFNTAKIAAAIEKAFVAENADRANNDYADLADQVVAKIADGAIEGTPTVEAVQDLVETVLVENGFVQIARAYIKYRAARSRAREMNTALMHKIDEITNSDAKDSDVMRENANIDANTAMGTMLKYGSETAKQYYKTAVIPANIAKAHDDGDIHIHDMDFYTLTTTCTQIDLLKLFKGGFSTGHGVLREPTTITSYAALACIAIQSNQNDQHGGQSICNFDYSMAEGVAKSYVRAYRKNLAAGLELIADLKDAADKAKAIVTDATKKAGVRPSLEMADKYVKAEHKLLTGTYKLTAEQAKRVQQFAAKQAWADTDKTTHQAMEAFIHNLNTMHSRAGAQTPFSSINYGMDTTPEGRMAMRNVMLATEEGLGNGETPIFPIQIFKVKEGVNYNPSDPNYDLFKQAMKVSAKRLFPNFSFIDSPFNAQYYKGTPETEIAYMGCRTRVMANVADPDNEITNGRGNLSFTSINLPRLGIRAKHDINLFYELLDQKLELVADQLLQRFEIQCKKKVYNMPFLMGQGVWLGSENLRWDDEVRSVLKEGTLTVGFIGLAETLVALIGEHHGQSVRAQNLGLDIIGHMRKFCDKKAEQTKLNFSLIATPAEGLSGRFVLIDRKKYGSLPGITDRDYYTNSFHVPVYYDINAFKKIEIEAPYHALTNGGHISYIELDGDPTKNLDAFEAVVRHMHDCGFGYGAINHPVDRDPVCGFNGIIDDACPACGRTEDDGDMGFERIRRITGYLVGTLGHFNNGKRAEEHDRVKHGVTKLDIASEEPKA